MFECWGKFLRKKKKNRIVWTKYGEKSETFGHSDRQMRQSCRGLYLVRVREKSFCVSVSLDLNCSCQPSSFRYIYKYHWQRLAMKCFCSRKVCLLSLNFDKSDWQIAKKRLVKRKWDRKQSLSCTFFEKTGGGVFFHSGETVRARDHTGRSRGQEMMICRLNHRSGCHFCIASTQSTFSSPILLRTTDTSIRSIFNMTAEHDS